MSDDVFQGVQIPFGCRSSILARLAQPIFTTEDC
jgi:hypothetical protein